MRVSAKNRPIREPCGKKAVHQEEMKHGPRLEAEEEEGVKEKGQGGRDREKDREKTRREIYTLN